MQVNLFPINWLRSYSATYREDIFMFQ